MGVDLVAALRDALGSGAVWEDQHVLELHSADALNPSRAFHISSEYCHGVGLKLAHLVEREWGSGLEVARRIKRALDPYGIMNPGKLGL